MLLKNKKGDIPVTILVIGVFAICVLAIFSFIYSSGKVKNNFVGAGLIETVNSVEEEIRFDEVNNLGRFNLPMEYSELNLNSDGKVLVQVDKNSDFLIKGNFVLDDEVLVSVNYNPIE